MNYLSRQRALQQELDRQQINALLITHLPNIRYLCGFTGSSGVLAFSRGEWAFFTDGRYTEQARLQAKGAKVHIGSTSALTGSTRWVADKLKRSRSRVKLGIEANHATVAMREQIASELQRTIPKSKCRLAAIEGIVEQLRMKKDPAEIDQIRKAVQLGSGIFARLVKAITPNATENDVAAELEYLARRAGAEKMSFESIVASGRNSALPHARPSRKRIGRGFVVVDYGVILGGYCSDMTRTVHMGRVDREARRVYSAVLEANLAGIQAVGPGVEVQQVDSAARAVLRKQRLDEYFTHSLGHGVGIEIHEAPRLAKGQNTRLEAGMVVTIEPGVYIPGSGGVRIEDMVLVTKRGCEVLTPTSKELITL